MSSTVKKVGKGLSNGVNSVLGGLDVSTDMSADYNLLNYFNGVDTSLADNASKNMAQSAYDLSQSLSSRPDYIYSVDGSDAARQRAEAATYQSYVDKLTPQYQTQMSDMETRLANQGLAVGSEAYQRAVNDLTAKQQEALNQAAYQSVLNGQNAFSQSLQNAINAGSFTNQARQMPISEIYSLLQNSMTGDQKAMNVYALQKGITNQQALDQQQSFNNLLTLGKFGMQGLSAVTSAGAAQKIMGGLG